MRDDPNVLPNYSSLPVYVQDLDMVNNREEDEEFIVRCWPVMDNVGILTTQEKSAKMNFNEYKTFISMFETDTDYLY